MYICLGMSKYFPPRFTWQRLIRYNSTKSGKGKRATVPSQEVSYAIKLERIEELNRSPSGWAPPSDPPPSLPFHISRTRTNRVPVFMKEKNGILFTAVTKVSLCLNKLLPLFWTLEGKVLYNI